MRRRRLVVGAGLTAALALGAVAGEAGAQMPVPRHLHCLTNEAGTHAVAQGLTRNAPQHAFENFHFNVHLGVFVDGPNPHNVFPVSPTGSCPP